jgi:hypothetical protein
MPRQQDQAGRRQRHNQDANDSKPSPTANVKSPSSPRKSLFNKSWGDLGTLRTRVSQGGSVGVGKFLLLRFRAKLAGFWVKFP